MPDKISDKRLTELIEEHELYEGESALLIAPLLRELLAARKLIARIKKTDDDIPLLPKDHCFVVAKAVFDECSYDIRIFECNYMDPTDSNICVWPDESDDPNCKGDTFTVLSIWSTREAAEAAKGKLT
jgi:hypothetical protein